MSDIFIVASSSIQENYFKKIAYAYELRYFC